WIPCGTSRAWPRSRHCSIRWRSTSSTPSTGISPTTRAGASRSGAIPSSPASVPGARRRARDTTVSRNATVASTRRMRYARWWPTPPRATSPSCRRSTCPAISTDWGVNPWLYNVDDATFSFIENVLDEVMALFPSTYIHVGGDEAIKDQWQASPAVQAKMHALGITDENALQGWFIGRIGQYLDRHGRKLIGWDEILEGDNLPADATVMSWRGIDGAIKAALLGH